MENRLLVDVARLKPGGETFEGEVDIIDLDEEFVKPFGGVRYSLTAQLFGAELLVRGRLEQDFDLVCSRCGRDFDTTVKVEDFTVSVEIAENQQEADLTADARESIILTLPTYPVCDEACPGIEQKAAEPPADNRWAALDGLEVNR
ncbi:MAG: hypothetical protein IJS36_06375 [Kiritimatiellae bacterium]|nr:hypothetical protein [Kiritimatiellia bacterium]